MDPAEINLPRLEVTNLLRQYGLKPKQGLGQNFLSEPAALRSVVEAAAIPPNAMVLEVGPGLGHLTRYLARAARQVISWRLTRQD
jgi:16S rRNA (adenine1518-N6/adenine1519-N6)-dimethyltransferase